MLAAHNPVVLDDYTIGTARVRILGSFTRSTLSVGPALGRDAGVGGTSAGVVGGPRLHRVKGRHKLEIVIASKHIRAPTSVRN